MKEIENIFNGIEEDAVWSIDLLNVHSSKREGVVYSAHRIQLDPSDFLKRHVLDLRDKYCLGNNSTLKKFSEIVDYDGTAESILVYRIKKDSELISSGVVITEPENVVEQLKEEIRDLNKRYGI